MEKRFTESDIQIRLNSKYFCRFCGKELKDNIDYGSQTHEVEKCTCPTAIEYLEQIEIQKKATEKICNIIGKTYHPSLVKMEIELFRKKILKEHGLSEKDIN